MEVAKEFLDKTGRKLADTRGPIMAALLLLMHILGVNIKKKKNYPSGMRFTIGEDSKLNI